MEADDRFEDRDEGSGVGWLGLLADQFEEQLNPVVRVGLGLMKLQSQPPGIVRPALNVVEAEQRPAGLRHPGIELQGLSPRCLGPGHRLPTLEGPAPIQLDPGHQLRIAAPDAGERLQGELGAGLRTLESDARSEQERMRVRGMGLEEILDHGLGLVVAPLAAEQDGRLEAGRGLRRPGQQNPR